MTHEDQLLFACIRQDLSPAQKERVHALCREQMIQWELVYSIAERHSVAPLVYANLRLLANDFKIPAKVIEQFERDYFYNIAAKEKLAEQIAKVLGFLNQKNIAVMLIKGGALDVLVPAHAWHTTANDVDLIFQTRRTEMKDSTISDLLDGFPDIHFEYDYFEHHDVTMNGMLRVDFERIWRDAHRIDYRGQKVWVMSPEDLLITACINSCRKRFFRLKALHDISEIVHHFSTINWKEVVEKARAYKCNTIVYAALVVTKEFMELQVPDQVFAALAVPALRSVLIRYLSRNISFTSLAQLYAGRNVFGREVGRGLLLPYATYRWTQLWKRIMFVSNFHIMGE